MTFLKALIPLLLLFEAHALSHRYQVLVSELSENETQLRAEFTRYAAIYSIDKNASNYAHCHALLHRSLKTQIPVEIEIKIDSTEITNCYPGQ